MTLLSLRGVISGLSSAFVALVAIITLTITLTTSLKALRNIGERHASSLLANANVKTEELFRGPADIVDTFKNITRGRLWPWPSDDPTTLQTFQQLHQTMFLSSRMTSAGILQYFYDNTRMGAENLPEHPDYYGGSSLVPAPYSIGGIEYQRTQPVAVVPYAYNSSTHVPQVPGDRVYQKMLHDLPPALPRDGSFWTTTLEPATLNGQATLTAGVYIFEQEGITLNYVPIVAPLYRAGSTPGKQNVYAYIIATLYTAGISDFLRTVVETSNTVAVAYDNGGYLLASTHEAPFETMHRGKLTDPVGLGCASSAATAIVETNYTYISCRTNVVAYPFEPLQTAASDEAFLFYAGEAVQLLSVGSDVWYAAVGQVPLRYPGMGVQLMLLLPEADVIGDIVTGRNLAIGITCGVFVVVAILSFVLISLLLAPLTTVSNRMMKAALLEDDDDARSTSAMHEVEQLQEAYYAMNDELNRIKSFVPQTVFAQRQQLTNEEEVEAEAAALNHERTILNSESDRESTRSAKSRSSRTASVIVGGGHAASMTVAHHNISVLVMNFNGFTLAANGRDRDVFVRGVSDAVTLIGNTVRFHNGVLQTFHGDHFIATFNAARTCAAHARMAVTAGLKIMQQAPTSGMKLTLRAAVATGSCLVGNMGSSEMKVFNTIGPVFMQACVLERMTRLYGSGCHFLAPKRTCLDIATHVRFRYVDIVMLPGSSKTTPIACITELRSESVDAQREAEWLYVVSDDDDTNTQRNEAFLQLAQGTYVPSDPMVPSPIVSLSNGGSLVDALGDLTQQAVTKQIVRPYSSLGKYYAQGFNLNAALDEQV